MLLLALIAVQAAQPQPAELRNFQDWTVGCDNAHRCEAIALLPEGEDWEQWTLFSLSRDAGGEARPVLEVLNLEWEPAELWVGERRLPVRFTATLEGSIIGDADGQVLRALREAPSLEVREGTRRARVSLAGASAAMLRMDEVQGRVGTVTALVRRGPRPASSVPTAAALPVVAAAPAPSDAVIAVSRARLDALGRETECSDFETGNRYDEVESVQIATGTTLVFLPCGSGAYNFSSVPYLARRHGSEVRLEIAPFDVQQLVEVEGRPMLTNAEWDEEARVLTEYNKGRGLGDCGSSAQYVWDGTRFRMIRYERMNECRGSLRQITTWRAEVRR